MVIYLDAGHRNNVNDRGSSGNGLVESELNLSLTKKIKEKLESLGIQVHCSRASENDIISLSQRTRKAKEYKANLLLSIHTNSYCDPKANGIEVFYKADNMFQLAQNMTNRMCEKTGARNRGAKKSNSLHILNNFSNSILVELGFLSNVEEAKNLKSASYQDKLVQAIIDAIQAHYKITKKGYAIVGKSTASLSQARLWARNKGATPTFIHNAVYYFEYCQKGGINPIVAYAQYAKESGFGKFGGILNASYHNPCGMKITQGGNCNDPNAHMRFDNWKDGIEAHCDHLALYAGAVGYPKAQTKDPRHFSYLLGKCKTVEELGGNWCPSKSYGTDLIKLCREIENTTEAHTDAIKVLVDKKIISSSEIWKNETYTKENVKSLIIKIAKTLVN